MMGPEAPRSQAPKLLNHSITLKTPYILSLTLSGSYTYLIPSFIFPDLPSSSINFPILLVI